MYSSLRLSQYLQIIIFIEKLRNYTLG